MSSRRSQLCALASRSLDSTVLCLVLHQALVLCLGGVGNGLWAIPTLHRPWLVATGCVLFPPAKFLAGRLLCIFFCRHFCAAGIHYHPLHTRVWRDCPFVSFLWKLYKTSCLLFMVGRTWGMPLVNLYILLSLFNDLLTQKKKKRTSSLLFRG